MSVKWLKLCHLVFKLEILNLPVYKASAETYLRMIIRDQG